MVNEWKLTLSDIPDYRRNLCGVGVRMPTLLNVPGIL